MIGNLPAGVKTEAIGSGAAQDAEIITKFIAHMGCFVFNGLYESMNFFVPYMCTTSIVQSNPLRNMGNQNVMRRMILTQKLIVGRRSPDRIHHHHPYAVGSATTGSATTTEAGVLPETLMKWKHFPKFKVHEHVIIITLLFNLIKT